MMIFEKSYVPGPEVESNRKLEGSWNMKAEEPNSHSIIIIDFIVILWADKSLNTWLHQVLGFYCT